jgi:ribonuclease P protein component
VVGRRVGGAVTRNRTKRRLRELLRRNPGWFAGTQEIVIRAGEGCEKLSFRKLGEILEQAGRRLARGEK